MVHCVVLWANSPEDLPVVDNFRVGGQEIFGFRVKQYNPCKPEASDKFGTRTCYNPPVMAFAIEALIDPSQFKCDIDRSKYARIDGGGYASTQEALNHALTGGIVDCKNHITYLPFSVGVAA